MSTTGVMTRGKRYLRGFLADFIRREMNPRVIAIERITEFVKYNSIAGDYLEFGVSGAHTFRSMYDRLEAIGRPDIHLYAFDSFQGLPKPETIDVHPDFVEGKFAQSRDVFEGRLDQHGISKSRYTVIEGFYNQVLTEALREKLPIRAAAVIWVDCDLYESTTQALRFVYPYIKTGTIIAFDDFFCFNGDPDRGEQKAFREFCASHRELQFVEFLRFSWAGLAFVAKVHDDKRTHRP